MAISAINAATSTTGVGVTTDAGSVIKMNGGTGIFAQSNGTVGGVTVTVGGVIGGPNIGVNAAVTNSANAGNAVVNVNNAIDAVVTGVIATSNGSGNVLVTGSGTIGATTSPNLLGIDASVTNVCGSSNVTVSVTGAITATNGVQALNAGLGSVLAGC
jgi:hypothetical protein